MVIVRNLIKLVFQVHKRFMVIDLLQKTSQLLGILFSVALPHSHSFHRANVKIPVLLLKEKDTTEFLRISVLNTFQELNELIQIESEKMSQKHEL